MLFFFFCNRRASWGAQGSLKVSHMSGELQEMIKWLRGYGEKGEKAVGPSIIAKLIW